MYNDRKADVYYIGFCECKDKLWRNPKRDGEIKIMRANAAQIIEAAGISREKYFTDMRFEDFKIKFFTFLKTERRPGTVNHFKLAVKYLENFITPKYLQDITPLELQELKQYLADLNKGPAGINKVIRCLKAMMRFAERCGFIRAQEWKNVSRLKEKKGRVIFYSEQELSKLLGAAKDGWRLVILLGARAGLRRGEIARLQWQDIDFRNNQIYVAPDKTENFRYIPMSCDLKNTLAAHPREDKNPYVINIYNGKGRRIDKERLTFYFGEVKKRAGIEKGTLHVLRHTFASHLVQAGVDLYSLSKLLGHSSVKTTEIYAHLTSRVLHDVIKKLPQI